MFCELWITKILSANILHKPYALICLVANKDKLMAYSLIYVPGNYDVRQQLCTLAQKAQHPVLVLPLCERNATRKSVFKVATLGELIQCYLIKTDRY